MNCHRRFPKYAVLLLLLFLTGWFPWSVQSRAGQIFEAVIARVNNDVIFLSELLHEEELLLQQIQRSVVPERRNEAVETMRRKLLDNLIERRLLEQKAKEMGLDVDSRLQKVIEQIMRENQIPDHATLRKVLRQQGITYNDFVATLRFQLLRQGVLMQYVQPRLVVTQKELQEYYQKHQEEFRTPVQWVFFQLRAPADADLASIRERIDQGTPPEVMKEQLTDNDRVNLTQIGPVEPDQLRQEVRVALKDQKIHTWVGPVNLDGDTIWLWLERVEGGEVPSFETVRDQIYQKVYNQKAEELGEKMLEEMKSKSFIKIYTENLPEPYRSYYAKADRGPDTTP